MEKLNKWVINTNLICFFLFATIILKRLKMLGYILQRNMQNCLKNQPEVLKYARKVVEKYLFRENKKKLGLRTLLSFI